MSTLQTEYGTSLRPWLTAFTAACCLTLAILMLLAFSHQQQPTPLSASPSAGIHFETIEIQAETGASPAKAAVPSYTSLLPDPGRSFFQQGHLWPGHRTICLLNGPRE